MTRTRMAAIFNEWIRQYAADPVLFSALLDDNGQPFPDYGTEAAATFERIDAELPA